MELLVACFALVVVSVRASTESELLSCDFAVESNCSYVTNGNLIWSDKGLKSIPGEVGVVMSPSFVNQKKCVELQWKLYSKLHKHENFDWYIVNDYTNDRYLLFDARVTHNAEAGCKQRRHDDKTKSFPQSTAGQRHRCIRPGTTSLCGLSL